MLYLTVETMTCVRVELMKEGESAVILTKWGNSVKFSNEIKL